MKVHFIYPELPPTSNKIYFRGTILTKKARNYAEQFAYYMVSNYIDVINNFTLGPNAILKLDLDFYFPNLINKTYNDKLIDKQKRAKTWYKKIDLSNRIKLLEDCIRDALAIDDSRTFEMKQRKFHEPLNPRVEIFIEDVDPKLYGVPPEPDG